MLGILLSAGVLGIVVAVMEDGEFPGWWPLIGCALITIAPSTIVQLSFPENLLMSFVGLGVGALLGGIAVAKLCWMDLGRAYKAVGIYFGIMIAFSLVIHLMF